MRVPLTIAVVVALMASPAMAHAQSPLTGSLGSSQSTPQEPAPEPPALDFTFETGPYRALPLPVSQQPYYYSFVNPVDPTVQDNEGVSVRVINGVEFDHPVLQAQYMLVRLNSYRINQNPAYLERVERHAARMMDYSVEVGDASFLPYPFDFPIHGRVPLTAPWYSGMAQGQALSAFTRLYQVTGNETYKDFADRLFVSLTQNKTDPNVPWVTQIDDDGYLWFEEYAKGDYSDYTYNGHMYGVIGLYDYYLAFNNPIALELYRGGMSTIRRYADEIRNPGDISSYCLAHPDVKSVSYHELHIREFRLLGRMTGDTTFDYLAELFRQDYTPPAT